MRTLLLLLLLAAPVQAEMTLQAPQSAVIGELVRFESAGSDEVSWKCIQDTSDFEAVGNRAFFSARTAGTYIFVVAGIVDDKPVILTHTLVVTKEAKPPEPPKPEPPKPAPEPPKPEPPKDLSQVEIKLKEVAPENKEAGPKLAQCFRALAESAVPADQMLASTVEGLKRATQDDPKWAPYLEVLAAYADTLDLKSKDDYKREWPKLADMVERSLK